MRDLAANLQLFLGPSSGKDAVKLEAISPQEVQVISQNIAGRVTNKMTNSWRASRIDGLNFTACEVNIPSLLPVQP